jgi:hypothetical protein
MGWNLRLFNMGWIAFCAYVIFGAPVSSDPPPLVVSPAVTLPAKIEARPGRLTLIKAQTNGRVIKWVSMEDSADVLPYLDNSCIFCAAVPGVYRILAYTALGDVPSDPALCTVTVRDSGSSTRSDVPARSDTPEKPPAAPADPLYGPFLKAWRLETDLDKRRHKAQLAALYRQHSVLASDTRMTTWGMLLQTMILARKEKLADTVLPHLRQAMSDEMTPLLPHTYTARLEPSIRQAAASVFARVAAVLESLP